MDPFEGPLQAFAYDLRKVRADAGNPTYRALAKVAGYSATTLSEAAGGIRKPTLDVVLAYVGACRGDCDYWRSRWEDLPEPVGTDAAPPSSGTVPPDAAGSIVRALPTGVSSPGCDLPTDASTPDHAQLADVSTPVHGQRDDVSTADRTQLADGSSPDHAQPTGVSTSDRVQPTDVSSDRAWPAESASPSADIDSGVLHAEPRPPGPVAAPPAPAGWWRRRRKVLVPVAAVLLLVAAGGAFVLQRKETNGCPRAIRHPAFTALTYGAGARIHTGAVRDAPVTDTVPSGCTVGFVGYCVGEKIHDNTGGSPDVRWFKLSDGEVIASGIVHGNPPPGLAPSHCTDDHPGPDAIALSVSGSHTLRLSASGAGLEIVGFAALFDPDGDQPGERRWRQVAFTEETTDRTGFTARWTAVPSKDGKPVLVAAAACLGGDGPTGVVTARTVTAAGFPDAALAPADRTSAAAAACSYPA